MEKGEKCGDTSNYGGIVLIGSHVKKTTQQLEALKDSGVPAEFLEFRVDACLQEGGLAGERDRIIAEAERVMGQGRTAVVYTSRELLEMCIRDSRWKPSMIFLSPRIFLYSRSCLKLAGEL